MKLERRIDVPVPHKIRIFIDGVLATPLENIKDLLKTFVWEFGKGNFDHWIDLFIYFDKLFDEYIKARKDLLLEDDFLGHDPPFPREEVLQILRVVNIILNNCRNAHFYDSYEHHLSSLLSSTDADVVEACLETLVAFSKRLIGKEEHTIKDVSLSSKLFAFAQGWGRKEQGVGLVTCAIENGSDSISHELGSTLHFEFSVANDLTKEQKQIIHLPKANTYQCSDLQLMQNLVEEYKVPLTLRFSLLTRLRFATAFGSFAGRQQYTCIRLNAILVLVQACGNTENLVAFFKTEPEFINELVTMLSYEDVVSQKVRSLCLVSMVSLYQHHSYQPTVLSVVTSVRQSDLICNLTQKAIIDAVASESSKWSIYFAETLILLVSLLVVSNHGCSAMCEVRFIPTLLPLLEDTDPQHLCLVSTSVSVLEALMVYSNLSAALFQNLGRLDETISRLNVEVSLVEKGSKQQGTSIHMDSSRHSNVEIVDPDHMQPCYSQALVSHHRRSLMEALLHVISLVTNTSGITSRVYGSEESLLPYCLCVIFRKPKDFGDGVFKQAGIVMSDLIHKDPTCFSILEAAGVPSAFLVAIMDDVLCFSEAITCIPKCLDALCQCNPGVDMLIEIIKVIEKLGYGPEATSSTCVTFVPMETDVVDMAYPLVDEQSSKDENSEKLPKSSVDHSLDVENFLPVCVNNATRVLETMLKNSDTCDVFIEKNGVEAVLNLLTLPLMPSFVSVGRSIAVSFKNFSPGYSTSIAEALSVFLKEHLKLTNELLVSLGDMPLAQAENVKRTKGLRRLSSLEGILSLLEHLTKGTNKSVVELVASDADFLRDIGATYTEILWQCSLCCDSNINENLNIESKHEDVNLVVPENSNAGRRDVEIISPEVVVTENLNKLASTLSRFFSLLVRKLTSKKIGIYLAIAFRQALGYPSCVGIDTPESLKCCYLGKVVDHMAAQTFYEKHGVRTCCTVMINNFYVWGTFKKLLNTFEATSQLIWTYPYSSSPCWAGNHPWLLNTIKSYCDALEFFVDYTFLSALTSDHLVQQPDPVEVGLFRVPMDTERFVRVMQSQVLDVILPIRNHYTFPRIHPKYITFTNTIFNHINSGVGVKESLTEVVESILKRSMQELRSGPGPSGPRPPPRAQLTVRGPKRI